MIFEDSINKKKLGYLQKLTLLSSHNIKNCSDSELIQKFREIRDNAIVGELFQRYTHLVFGVCMKYLKNEDEAKDGVMQVFEKILTDLHKHEVQNFKGWLYIVAKNYCLMNLRNKKIQVELPIHLTEDSSDECVSIDSSDFSGIGNQREMPVELVSNFHLNGEDKENQLVLMEKAIKELKEHQRICIELFYLQEKSYEEVSNITGYSMKEVKSFIQNGKRNLKIIMTTGKVNTSE